MERLERRFPPVQRENWPEFAGFDFENEFQFQLQG
jgi:hypothetical protein